MNGNQVRRNDRIDEKREMEKTEKRPVRDILPEQS